MAVFYDKALARLRSGETVLRTLPEGGKASDKELFNLSGGGLLHAGAFRKLKADLEVIQPGLFPEAPGQVYRLRNGA